MPERVDATAALFAEILADPRREAARLVYADHLIERGDPRGELIQLQCRVEALAPDDPARRPLARRIADLLGVHETAWTRDVRALGFDEHVHQVTLRRGFVEKVRLDAAQHATVAMLRARTPLRHVQLRVRDGDGLATLAALGPAVAELEGLAVHADGPPARRAFAAAFARWPRTGHLRHLDVEGGELAATLATDAALAGLETLRIRALGAWVDALVAARHLATVTTLELPRAAIGAPGAARLAGADVFANLTRLDVQHGALDAGGGRALAGAAFAPRLVQLRIHANPLGPIGAAALVARCTALELLDLEATELRADGVGAVLGGAHLDRLRSLDLSRNPLDDAALATTVATRWRLPALRHLVLRDTGAGPHTARALAAAAGLGALRTLELADNPLGDAGLVALAASSRLGALEVLRLAGTGVGARGLRALATGPLASRLRALDLGRNGLDDDALAALVTTPLPALTALHLDGARVSARGIAALVASPLAAQLEHLVLTGVDAGALAHLFAAALPALRTLVADPVDDHAALALATARGLPRLHEVTLRARALTDAGARALADATSLGEITWLELDAANVGEHGRAWLRGRFGHHVGVFAGASLYAFAALGRRV